MTYRPRHGSGFTLVEVLVAIGVMAVLAVMAWSGLDGMGRAQAQTRAYSDDVLALQSGLAQWGADLDAMAQVPPVGGAEFDGRVLRITRYYLTDESAAQPSGAAPNEPAPSTATSGGGSLRVVAWGARLVDGKRQWLRWQSGPLRTRGELQLAWQQAGAWGENPTEDLMRREVAVASLDDWQVFYYRDNAWSSPLSSAGARTPASSNQTPLPDGVRLVLTLSAGQAVAGKLTRDWARLTLGAGRS